MTGQPFAAAHQQAIDTGHRLAIAEAEGTPLGAERQHTSHRVAAALGIVQLPAEQQQAAALRHDR